MGIKFYSDLESGSMPPSIIVPDQRPDLVIINDRKSPTSVHLVELTIPFDTANAIENAKDRKTVRYTGLVSDLKWEGYEVSLNTLEIGARGYVDKRNKGTLVFLCHMAGVKRVRELTQNISKLALIGSRASFNARNINEWTS